MPLSTALLASELLTNVEEPRVDLKATGFSLVCICFVLPLLQSQPCLQLIHQCLSALGMASDPRNSKQEKGLQGKGVESVRSQGQRSIKEQCLCGQAGINPMGDNRIFLLSILTARKKMPVIYFLN